MKMRTDMSAARSHEPLEMRCRSIIRVVAHELSVACSQDRRYWVGRWSQRLRVVPTTRDRVSVVADGAKGCTFREYFSSMLRGGVGVWVGMAVVKLRAREGKGERQSTRVSE